MESLDDSSLDKEINNDLQNELLELADLYPDSEEEDILQNENDLDDEGLFENDYETIEQGFQLNVSLQDPLLQLLKLEYGDSIFYNTDEENEVILHCLDKDLQALLIKNRVRAKQLRVLRNKLVKVLQDCIEKTQCSTQAKRARTFITLPKLDTWKLGIPYFKDGQFYRCPENSDEIKKRVNQEFSMLDFHAGRRWAVHEQVTLESSVQTCYYNYRVNEVQLRVNVLKMNANNDENAVELLELTQELKDMKMNPAKYRTPPPYSNVGINWSIVADSLKGMRSANECKAMWNVYLHPRINKNVWTDEENERIKTLVKKHNHQNWDLIAQELNTNRSGYLVFINYSSTLWNKFKMERFQPEEDEYLLKIVEKCRVGNFIPWRKVSLFFEARSKHQLYHRYKYYISQSNIIKGTFSKAEDIFIMYLVGKFGKDYSKCAEFMPRRTSVQIRNRYASYLDKVFVNFGSYSETEDQMILEHVRLHGTKDWSSLAKVLERGRSHVRQRYLTLSKWLEKSNRNVTIIPSRTLRVLSKTNADRLVKLREVVNKLNEYSGEVNLDVVKDFIKQQEEEVQNGRNPWRVMKKKHSRSFIDGQLVNFFKGTCKIQRECKSYGEQSIKDSAARVKKLLELFAASPDLLDNIEPDEGDFTERESEVITVLKNGATTNATFLSLTPQIRFFLPPTLNTVLGLRGLIVKYQMHKNSNKCVDTWMSEQNLSGHDDRTKRSIEKERRIFFERFYALFRWPSIISVFFPEQFEKTISEPVKSLRNENEMKKRPRGRPPKTEYPKVALMLNGRKRKRFECDLNATNVSVVLPRNVCPNKKSNKDLVEAYPLKYLNKAKGEKSSTITGETLERLKQHNKIVVLEKTQFKVIRCSEDSV
ncbi:hypothetical protein RN001_015388 [Aquatica leii]|uniref:snRNA-activating protein complex subunit 4 n=1 Tax=Aquatica leii TaxID=1421715 RepID=A0AAN7SDA2_9COLE|nr:hypothetical protein RN001_015388 [Aquatica leii]